MRVIREPGRVVCPGFADGLVGGEAAQGLDATCEVIGCDKVGEVLSKLIVAVAMKAFHGRFLDRPVHPLDPPVRPGMTGLGQAVLDVEINASSLESMAAKRHLLSPHGFDAFGLPTIAVRIGDVCAIVGEHNLDFVGNSGGKGFEKVSRNAACRLFMQLDEREI